MVDTYDAVGNRTGRNQDGVLTTWTYDNSYRLTGQQTSGGYATFTYDAVGNTLVKHQQGSSPMLAAATSFRHWPGNTLRWRSVSCSLPGHALSRSGDSQGPGSPPWLLASRLSWVLCLVPL